MHFLQDPLTLFIVQAVLIIAAARVVGLLARRLEQPMVIAEIVAGIVLGPSLLGLVAPDVMTAIFPPASLKLLGLMSQTGLVLFMFLVGLELDPTMLRGRGKSSVMISHCSIIVPFALGVTLSFWLRPALGEPADSLSFALFMGVAMAITAFPVLARILTERQLLRTPIGAVAIACAAVDDITAWCVLAFVVSIVRAGGVFDAVWTTAFALVYIFTMLWVVRPLLHRLGARMGTDRGPSQNVMAAVFIVLFASAWTTELIGIHALFGAFMFGAIVPKENGFARVIAEKLEDVVVVFLLPLFFAYSGLRTQIGLLDSGSHWIWCALIILLACLGKFGGSFVPARLTGLGWRESAAVGVLMNTRGLMELVVLNIGLDLGVISPTVFTMMVLMALFTTFITSPMLQWVYPLELLRKDIIRRQAPVAAAVPREQPALSVMVCVADARSAAPMVQLAAGLVGREASAEQVLALHLRAPAERTSSVIAGATEYALPPATRASEAAAEHGLELRTLAFDSADPARDICEVAAVKDIDLVVIGAHRPLVGHAHLGGIVRRVLENAAANVGVLVPRGSGDIRRILVPFADNPHDRLALELARRLHTTWGAQVTVLHVTAPSSTRGPAARAVVDEMFPGEVGGAGVRFKVVEHADAAQAVLDESRSDCELVVVGVGREWGMPQRAFGLRTERLLEQGSASLLVVRASADPLPMRQPAVSDRDPGERAGGT